MFGALIIYSLIYQNAAGVRRGDPCDRPSAIIQNDFIYLLIALLSLVAMGASLQLPASLNV